jgi:hypothetical protein
MRVHFLADQVRYWLTFGRLSAKCRQRSDTTLRNAEVGPASSSDSLHSVPARQLWCRRFRRPRPRSSGVLAEQSQLEAESSEPSGQELSYAARVSLDQTTMQVEDRVVDLTPGMAVTVEIKTGSRRVITYLLSPLLKFKQESLRER